MSETAQSDRRKTDIKAGDLVRLTRIGLWDSRRRGVNAPSEEVFGMLISPDVDSVSYGGYVELLVTCVQASAIAWRIGSIQKFWVQWWSIEKIE